MADYSEGKIYLVKFRNDPSLVYVGSTKQSLNERFRIHKKDSGRTTLKKYIHDNHNGNWDDWYIELYEDYPCLNREELERKEGEITLKFKNDNTYKCINKYIAGRTIEEWCKENKEKLNKINKKYYENNKEKINEKRKEKFTCSCGSICRIGDKSTHLKTQKHLASLSTE